MNNHAVATRGRRRSSSRSSGSGPSSFTTFTRRHTTTNASTTSSDRSRLSSRRHSNSNANTNANGNASQLHTSGPAADVARLLDPAYAPSWHHRSRSVGHEFSSSYTGTGAAIGRIQEQVRAYVDEDGELHDPDYRVFPVFPPRVRPMGLSNYSHGHGYGSGGRTNPSLMASTMPRRHTVSGQPTTTKTTAATATTRNLWAERPTARERWASAIVDSDEDDDELNRDGGRGRSDSVASYTYTHTSNRSRSHTPACSLSRTTSTRSSVHTAASYMYRDAASVVSAPATLHGTEHSEMDFIESVGEMEVEDDDFVTSAHAKETGSAAEDTLFPEQETCSSGGKWSFLHRMMRTPASSQPQSQVSPSPIATPALDVPRESPRGRSRSRNRSGSVLSCLPLSGSTSVSLTPPTSPHSHSHPDNAKHGVEETLVAHEERESTKQADEDVEVMYLDQQSGVAEDYYVSPTETIPTTTFMCRPVRVVNLRVRTRLWRVSKRMAESRGKLCAWIDTKLRRGACKEKTPQNQQ